MSSPIWTPAALSSERRRHESDCWRLVEAQHRVSTLKSCNTVHLVNKGRIVASGAHKDLVHGHKLYRHLYYLEYSNVEDA